MAKILVVEDNPSMLDDLRKVLTFEQHMVDLAGDGAEALFRIKTYDYDLIVLDWELPDTTGVEICREYRSRGGKAPVLMLTGKSMIADKEQGLDSGADDYLTKPFDVRELNARVRSLLRRPAELVEDVLSAGDLRLDPKRYVCWKGSEQVNLLPREFQLLGFLMGHPSRIYEPEELLNRVWPSDSDATVSALTSTLKRLRKKVDPDGTIILTIRGVGICLKQNKDTKG
jgi:DNA-binding response OmpR family regulator